MDGCKWLPRRCGISRGAVGLRGDEMVEEKPFTRVMLSEVVPPPVLLLAARAPTAGTIVRDAANSRILIILMNNWEDSQ